MSYRADKLMIDGHMDVPTDRQTDTHTHTQATTTPEGQNWPRVKMETGTTEHVFIMAIKVIIDMFILE